MADIEAIPVSALNQYAYCPRRCGLIHQKGEFTNNFHTARGNAKHERVDRAAHETLRSGACVEYALPVWSDRQGLIGKCDGVEFWLGEKMRIVDCAYTISEQRLREYAKIPELERLRWLDELARFTLMARAAPDDPTANRSTPNTA